MKFTKIFKSSYLILIVGLINFLLISFYDNDNDRFVFCNNYILCKVSAQSNATRDDFPERDREDQRDQADESDAVRDEFPPEEAPPREDFPDTDRDADSDRDRDADSDRDREATSDRPQDVRAVDNPNDNTNAGGSCLIATAAFGSELTAEVQFLRDFRDDRILSTGTGSSFMNAFNSWYYSFSPHIADYERDNPWFQNVVKASIYPLLGVLFTAEKPYMLLPSEYGAITSGFIASSLIGMIYFSPFVLLLQLYGRKRIDLRSRFYALLITAALGSVLISLSLNNNILLTVTTSTFVLISLAVAAIMSATLILKLLIKTNLIKSKFN